MVVCLEVHVSCFVSEYIGEVIHLSAFFQKGVTALHYVALHGVKDGLKFLLAKGANVNVEDNVSTTVANFPIKSCISC